MTLVATPSALDPSLYISELKPKRRDSVLAEMVELAHRAGSVRDPAPLLELLLCRERLGTTAIGKGAGDPQRPLARRSPAADRVRSFPAWHRVERTGCPARLARLAGARPAECSKATAHYVPRPGGVAWSQDFSATGSDCAKRQRSRLLHSC
jgi:hypothetical protein